ncbi:MAG: hypothetical protein QG670_950 [Thermoproteota archaeon]|nr:hypothetical protein [Thermoproteota archaeon]
MDVFEAIKDRRSIRHFKPNPITDEQIEKILEAAIWAPSAGNLQARDYIVIKDHDTKKKLCESALNQHFIQEASINIVVCANEERSAWKYSGRGRELYCILDAAAAVQNILLAAHSLGLGACWIGAFNDGAVSKILNLPRGLKPIAIIPIGYPEQKPNPPPRFSLKDVSHINRYEAKRRTL